MSAEDSPRTFDPIRAAALDAIIRIEQGADTNDGVTEAIKNRDFRPLDVRFLLQLVNGTTKMRRRLDYEIKFYLAKPSQKQPPHLLNILRMGFYQLMFTDKIPAAAAVSESVNLAYKFADPSQAKLVNAIMRAKLREPEKVVFPDKETEPLRYLTNFYSYPDHFVEYCLLEFGVERTEQLLAIYNKPRRVTYRVNTLKASVEDVINLLTKNKIPFSRGLYLPEFIHVDSAGLPLEQELVQSGKVYVQDESAGLAVRMLNPKPGGDVVDLTAAPGGKSTYIAIKMHNKGRLTAVDKSRHRLEILVENARRLGINIISPVACDMADFHGGPFDRVLLDPPCTGWGTASKHADLRWAKSTEDMETLTKIQTKMIDRAAKLVKPGGVLVYSTCTITRAENDQVVEEFLVRNDKFEVDSAQQYFPKELVSTRGFVKTYPGFADLDGAFCARLRRKPHS
jgi:16S rRNA (cytosine967-C5)-methyltransferase